MKRFLIAGGAFLASTMLVAGCGSSNQPATASTASAHIPYAGGDGAFGEDPVQPGEHSRERFMNAVNASEQVSPPAAQPVTAR